MGQTGRLEVVKSRSALLSDHHRQSWRFAGNWSRVALTVLLHCSTPTEAINCACRVRPIGEAAELEIDGGPVSIGPAAPYSPVNSFST